MSAPALISFYRIPLDLHIALGYPSAALGNCSLEEVQKTQAEQQF